MKDKIIVSLLVLSLIVSFCSLSVAYTALNRASTSLAGLQEIVKITSDSNIK